jgi:hypothetical protein
MEEHRGIGVREGPSGRRAVVIAGPDVWEVARAVRSVREAEPDLDAEAVVGLTAETMGLAPGKVHLALDYWATHRDEIERQLRDADEAAHVADELWRLERGRPEEDRPPRA